MATRHLYHSDDVAATLLFSIQQNQRRLAKEAASELLGSQEPDLLFRCLALAWFLDDPGSPYEKERYDAFCANDAQALLGSLLRKGYDLPEALPSLEFDDLTISVTRSTPETPIDRIALKGWTRSQTRTLGFALTSAMKKKSWTQMEVLLTPLVKRQADQVAQILMALGVAESLAILVKTSTHLSIAQRILRHALSSLVSTTSTSPPRLTISLASERTLTLPAEALSLWHCDTRPLSELHGAPVLVAEEQATHYWITSLQTHGGSLKGEELLFQRPEDEESFYTQGFPHDIPDEWSDEERQKSHGITVSKHPNPWVPVFAAFV